jgi:hypothetical protein
VVQVKIGVLAFLRGAGNFYGGVLKNNISRDILTSEAAKNLSFSWFVARRDSSRNLPRPLARA